MSDEDTRCNAGNKKKQDDPGNSESKEEVKPRKPYPLTTRSLTQTQFVTSRTYLRQGSGAMGSASVDYLDHRCSCHPTRVNARTS